MALVAAVVVRHDHRSLAGHVAAGTRAGQRRQYCLVPVARDLDQLGGAAVVASGQDPPDGIGVECLVGRQEQQALEIGADSPPLCHTDPSASRRQPGAIRTADRARRTHPRSSGPCRARTIRSPRSRR